MLNVTNHQRNANKTTMRYHLIPNSVATIKTTTTGNNKYW